MEDLFEGLVMNNVLFDNLVLNDALKTLAQKHYLYVVYGTFIPLKHCSWTFTVL